MRLVDKVAIVTGASSGIGKSIAYLFTEEGAKVVVADVNATGGEETVTAIKKNGGTAEFIKTDVTVASEDENLAKATQNKFGKIDILVNVAGIFMKETPFEDIDESTWDLVYAVNVKGSFLTAKYIVPLMKKAGTGVIINIASMAGVRPGPHAAAYCSSKGAVITLTKALAIELVPSIRVNCINPAPTETQMIENISEELKKTFMSMMPIGRLAQPEDIAYAALYLACDESSMLTGTSINVDGGSGV